MLRTWLAPLTLEDFLLTHLGRAAYARPGAAESTAAWFDWNELDCILALPTLEILIAAAGQLVQAPVPRTLAQARELLRQRYGIVIRKAEQHVPHAARLARVFAEDLPGEVQVQLYVTPRGTRTFGWRFDAEDVFIAQTAGITDYYFRANTVSRNVPGQRPDFGLVRTEKSQLMMTRLIPGDWLYIPACWWHLAGSVEDALSISVGILPNRPRLVALQPRAR
jgi:50S ribosomal protein L16 3-hydroxylase